MVDNEKFLSCRLKEDELNYINNYYDGSFSNYVHNSIKRDLELSKKNRKHNFISNFTQQIIMLGLGAIFIFFSLSINNIYGFVLMFLFGVFFIVSSLFNIYIGMIKKWKMNSLTNNKT